MRQETAIENYIEQCKELSLTARMVIALIIFERYCKQKHIENSIIDNFCNHLWRWPLIDGPDQFEPWEQSRTVLINYGLGEQANEEIQGFLSEYNVDEYIFRQIISGIVEILWGNFWGGSEDELSLQSLHDVIRFTQVENLPTLTPFKFSRFRDGGGWGQKITAEDCEFWKNCV